MTLEIVVTPDAGVERLARKGEALTATATVEAVDAITTAQSYTAEGLTVPAGRLSMWRTYPSGRLYQAFGSLHRDAPPGESTLVVGGVFVPDDGGAPKLYWNDYARGPVFIEAPDITFTPTPYSRNTLIAVKRDLVFEGAEGGKASITYREFEGDMARPRSTETISHDLAGGELVFRGARVQLLGVEAEELRYIMLEPLNPPFD